MTAINGNNGHNGNGRRNLHHAGNGNGANGNGHNHAPAVAANPDNIATVGFMRQAQPRRHTAGDANQNTR